MSNAAKAPVRRVHKKTQRIAEIIEAGARLIHSRGFANTSVADVTREIGIAPSAMYRHFPSKEKLLAAILDKRFLDYEHALDECDGWGSVADNLSPIAVRHRDLGVLWQREARNMASDDYERLAARLRAVARRISRHVDTKYAHPLPIARAWATISILTSLSYHSTPMSQERLLRLLPQLIRGVGEDLHADAKLHSWSTEKITTAVPATDDTLDDTDLAILEAAARLYGTRGYHQVSMTDLGQAVGLAGPSIYHRYSSKGTVLAAVLRRASARLVAEARAVLDSATDPAEAMKDLLNSYARLVASEPHTVEALLSEIPHLVEGEREPAAEMHQKYVKAWGRQLRRCFPEMTPAESMVRVHAAMTIVNDLSRTHSTRAELSVDDLCGLAWSAMWAGLSEVPVST